jgi:hypothetical protein
MILSVLQGGKRKYQIRSSGYNFTQFGSLD